MGDVPKLSCDALAALTVMLSLVAVVRPDEVKLMVMVVATLCFKFV